MKRANRVTPRDLEIFKLRDDLMKYKHIAVLFGISVVRARQIYLRVSRLKDLGNWELVGENGKVTHNAMLRR